MATYLFSPSFDLVLSDAKNLIQQSIFIILVVFVPSNTNAQGQSNFIRETTLLKNALLLNHYSPRQLDDDFSLQVYNEVLDELDPDRLFFTKMDLQALSIYKTTIDNEVMDNKISFLTALILCYKKSLARSEDVILSNTENTFDLNATDVLKMDTRWANDDLESKERWRKKLKYDVLLRLIEIRSQYIAMPDADFIKKYEPQARQRVKLAKIRSIKRILNYPGGFEIYVASVFLKSITSSFDPHSAYMSASDMDNFMTSLSTEGYFFGITINENENGDVVIEQLTPGGPAWKSGQVHSGDVIHKLQWEGNESVDIEGVGIEEANEILSATNHSSLSVTTSDIAGQRTEVILKKEKIESSENIVKSFVLQGDKKIGYISLPGFYTNWNEGSGSNCANDVAKEILKLKKENIEGLILDVRYNGGGSLQEAVAMAGIFIDAGPIGLLKNKDGVITAVKDMNRGTIYDDALVLLVNGLSASASEFLAAALQDYHRGIIVGGQTYGKATMQDLLPLDPKVKTNSISSNIKSGLGFAKITTSKIYRVTGKTAQLNGVTPDIVLPDVIGQFKFREALAPRALPSDSVQKKIYYTPLVLLPLQELRGKSEARVSANKQFKTLEKYGKWAAERDVQPELVTLNWTSIKKEAETKSKIFHELKIELNAPTAPYKASSHSFQQQHMQMDEYVDALAKGWIKNLEQDVALEEAYHIICDYLAINSRKK